MALMHSTMMPLGTRAPNFNLLDTTTNKEVNLEELKSDLATVILFICNHCPYVHHINNKLVEMANHYQRLGISFIAISSNNVLTHPQDGPDEMTKTAKKENYPFPYLYDETQDVAKAYQAECTPDLFVFDSDLKCVYRGRFDETRPNMGTATGKDLSNALEAILNKEEIPDTQHPSMGCGIKWK